MIEEPAGSVLVVTAVPTIVAFSFAKMRDVISADRHESERGSDSCRPGHESPQTGI